MKKMIAAAAMLAVTSAHAAEELKFGDLNFLVPAGNFQLSAAADFRTDRNTVNGEKTEVEGYYLDTLLTYGLTERLNLYAGLNYQYEVNDKDLTNTGNSHISKDGLANPVVGGLFRVLGQNNGAFNFDLGVTGRFRVQDAKDGASLGTETKDGNAADGRHSVEVYGRLGNKWNEANEWQFQAGIIHHLEGERDELQVGAAADEFEMSASTDIYARASYQYRPVNEFMMAVALQATQVEDSTEENKATGDEMDSDSHLDWDFDFTAKYLVTSNFITRFNLGVGSNPDYDIDAAGTTVEVEKRHETRLGLGVDWLF